MNIWEYPTKDARAYWLDRKTIRIEVPLGDSFVDLTPTQAKKLAKKILSDPRISG